MQTHYDYLSDIEQTFIRRRGRNLFLSPKDWALMQAWEQRGIPLHIATGAVEQCFDKNERIGSLAYCAPAVEESFKNWQDAQVGKHIETEADHTCPTCFDLGTVHRPKPNSQYSFEMEEVPCPKCAVAVQ